MLSPEIRDDDSARKGLRESVKSRSFLSEILSPDFLRRRTDFETMWLYMLKGGLDKRTRDSLGRSAADFVARSVLPVLHPNGDLLLDKGDAPTLTALQEKGYAPVADVFSADDIAEIKAYFQNIPGSISGGGAQGYSLLKDVPAAAGFTHFHATQMCACAPIYRVLHDERLIKLATFYLGAPATIGISTVWWSYPAPGSPEGMQMFHHDRGDFRSCNLFVYLSDVDAGTGPHAFVERTHDMDVLMPLSAQRFCTDPQAFQDFWKWMEQHRKTDAEVLKYFPADEVKSFVGPAGTSFFEDTRGLHKGTRPTTGPRVAFEIFYSVLPKFNEEIKPLRRADLPLPAGLEKDTEKLSPLVRYAMRQYLI